ncbi:hypothetical protein [Mesorhizobium sp. ES1-3]|uniref:hypothetical protein n=1 Tax=Mesorhizobium sp. ES1-3 TaxID=2876628 RepID=UPI001CCFA57D|nr:hypothetical protein [Mesorhizobium sp. ES1-3]MBZ9673479.1 hypothetical protein [Mesorhizobium sp. ES1-3]
MQDRYAGDVGDYAKFAFLRCLAQGRSLGIAWYLHPDEGHNSDGKHISYLNSPDNWRHLDPVLFDTLSTVVANGRSISSIERSGALKAQFSGEKLVSASLPWQLRSQWRRAWFRRLVTDLDGADLVFADPDNGLVDDDPSRPKRRPFGKQMPLSEVNALAQGRTTVVYHHNSRFKGGHDAEVEHWLRRLGNRTIAVRATAFNCRTFFVVNPDDTIVERAKEFCGRWSGHKVRFHVS